jgi:LmbE family N-acetylglucosaminyl deacetylase
MGYRIVNLVASLGKRDRSEQRRAEVAAACQVLGFDLVIPNPPARISLTDDLREAETYLSQEIRKVVDFEAPIMVISPSPHDRHHGHEVVARATRRALELVAESDPPRWWMWGLWGDLPLPNIMTLFQDQLLSQLLLAMEQHRGETARNDYAKVIRGRALMNACLGAERVFGFGKEGIACDYAELLTEAVFSSGTWRVGRARLLTPDSVLATPTSQSIHFWLDQLSLTSHFSQDDFSR